MHFTRVRLTAESINLFLSMALAISAAACGAETPETQSTPGAPGTPATLSGLDRDLRLGDDGTDVLAVYRYLEQYGYFPNTELARKYPAWRPAVAETPDNPRVFDERMEVATLALQRNSGLLETGIVDAETRSLLSKGRCGVPDNIPTLDPTDKFSHWGSRWPGSNVTWRVTNGENNVSLADARTTAAIAFDSWARTTNLTFTQLTSGTADIMIRFQAMDGLHGIIGQQAVPPPGSGSAGDIVMDSDENWTTGGGSNMRDLRTALLHEIGHALGLGHSSVSGGSLGSAITATMHNNVPFQDQSLAIDDRVAISTLYDVFQALPFGTATDIGATTDGSVWAIGASSVPGGFNIQRWSGSVWQASAGGAVRIAVEQTGRPWIVNSFGEIFRRTSASATTGSWQLIPGCARDIGVGKNGTVWAIGCNAVPGGFGLHKWNGSSWDAANGGATRVAVDENGVPWVVNDSGFIYRRLSANAGEAGWENLPGCARDIGIGDGNYAWVIGCNALPGGFSVHVWNEQAELNPANNGAPGVKTWRTVPGGAVAISVGLRGSPWVVNNSGVIFNTRDVP